VAKRYGADRGQRVAHSTAAAEDCLKPWPCPRDSLCIPPVIPPRQPQRPLPPATPPDADDDWPVDPGRPLGLRLLALLGALSFVMLGLSSLVPLLNPQPPAPPRAPDQPARSVG